jgi:hypothetical protein
MPCQSDFEETAADRRLSNSECCVQNLRLIANEATRAACDMRTILRRHGLENELTIESRNWIKEHDAQDAIRIARETASGSRERTKQIALDKLTLEERRSLGL